MSHPTRILLSTALLAAGFIFAGCSTIYDDMYSPKRSRFTPPAPKTSVELPPEPPPGSAPSSQDSVIPGNPGAIPGLESLPAPTDPAPIDSGVPGL